MRKCFTCVVLLSLFILIPVTALAHSGRTDSNGGHHSSDGYHYHHGYPPHDHYDMTGDGIIDCPYKFNDKTGISSGNGSSGSGSSGTSNVLKPEKEKDSTMWTYWLIAILCVIIAVLAKINSNWHKRFDSQASEHKKELQKNADELKLRVYYLNSALEDKYGMRYLYDISGVPEDVVFGKDMLPTDNRTGIYKWGETFTFYTTGEPDSASSQTPMCFHTKECRYVRWGSFPINAYTIHSRDKCFRACCVCRPKIPAMHWADRYYMNWFVVAEHLYPDRISQDIKKRVLEIEKLKKPKQTY